MVLSTEFTFCDILTLSTNIKFHDLLSRSKSVGTITYRTVSDLYVIVLALLGFRISKISLREGPQLIGVLRLGGPEARGSRVPFPHQKPTSLRIWSTIV